MTTTSSTTTELLVFISDEIALDPTIPVEVDTDLLLTGLVDSLGVVQIVSWMEERFSITIEPTDVILDNFQTPQAMLDYLSRRQG